MQAAKLDVKERLSTGKGYARRLRAQGDVPSVIYGKEIGSKQVEMSAKQVEKLLDTFGENALVKLNVNGEEYDALVREVQRNPLRGTVIHVDFMQISLKDKLQTTVSIYLSGDAEGVSDGGIVQHGLREVDVECLPTDIPDYLEVDISGMKIGDSLTVASLQVPEGVEVLSEPNSVLATLVPPRMEEEETDETDEEVDVEGSSEEEATEK